MKPSDLIWLFLPEEALPLLVMVLATLTIIGLVKPRRVISALALVLLLPAISAVVETIVTMLPWYVTLILLVSLVTNTLRVVMEVFVGREAAGHILGHMVLRLLRIGGYVLLLPFRALRQLFRQHRHTGRLARRYQP